MAGQTTNQAGRWWRRVLLIISTALVLALPLAARPVSAANSPAYWQQFGADAANSNHSNDTALTTSAVGNLAPEFSLASTPDFSDGCFRTMREPVANATSLFVFDGPAITAVNLSTGRQVWRTPLNPRESPTDVYRMVLYGSTLIVGETLECDSPGDPDGTLAAYNINTGKLVWTYFFDNPIFTMALSGSTLIDSGDENWGSTLEARSASTGAVLWTHDYCYGYFVVGSEVISDCGAISVSTGALLWAKTGWTYWRGDGPSVANPQIYATDPSGHLTAMSANGATVWSSTTERGPVLAVGATRIYVRCDTNALCALSRTTGARQWKDAADNPGAVALAGNVAFPTPGENPLNVDTGAQITTYELDLSSADGAQVSNGHLLVESGRILDVYSLQ